MSQRFNPKSASMTAIFMFVYISGIVYDCGRNQYTSQRFNPKSASVTAIFMFVYIVGIVYDCGRNQVYVSEI